MKSEFPETKWTRLGKRFGWILSPLLFLSLLTYTFLTAQNLQFDPFSGDVKKFGNVHIKEISDTSIYFDGEFVGKSNTVLKTEKVNNNQSIEITANQNDKRQWKKIINPREGFVSILYPVIYPNNLNFEEESITANKVYSKPQTNFFYYEKIINNSIYLYKYESERLLITVNKINEEITDLTPLLKKSSLISDSQELLPQDLKERFLHIGNSGDKVALVIPNEKIYIIESNGTIKTVPNYTPQSTDKIFWSQNDEYMVIGTEKEILSVNTSQNTINVVYRALNNERLETQFTFENGIVYKVINSEFIDLRENNFQGNNQISVELPNIDNLRRNNLISAYNLIEEQNSLLLQSAKNIYLFNLASFEIKKINNYENETIVYVDPKWEIVITRNNLNNTQYRYYNLETSENKTFTINDITVQDIPNQIYGYNYGQNLTLGFKDKIIYLDSDGANQIIHSNINNPIPVSSSKIDKSVLFFITERNNEEDKTQNPLVIKLEQFNN